MPMNPLAMENKIREFTDPSYGSFVAWPVDGFDAAAKWAAAVTALTLTIVPAATNHAAAEAAMTGAMGANLAVPGGALTAFDFGFTAYAGTLATGMVPSGIPPPTAWSISGGTFASLIAAGLGGASKQAQAALFAANTFAYFVTGTVSGSGNPWA